MSHVERLAARVRRGRASPRHTLSSGATVTGGEGELAPNAYAAVMRAQLEALQAEVSEIKGRVNGLLWAVVAAVVIDVARDLLR